MKYLVAPDIDLCAFEGHFLSVFQSGIFAAAEISRKLPLRIEWDQPNPNFCLCVSRLPEDTRIMSYVRFWAKDLPVAYPPFRYASRLKHAEEWGPQEYAEIWSFVVDQVRHVFEE